MYLVNMPTPKKHLLGSADAYINYIMISFHSEHHYLVTQQQQHILSKLLRCLH